MTDIVVRLRYGTEQRNDTSLRELCLESADEIERLRDLLSSIRFELDGVPWSADTLQAIAQMMHAHGYTFREPR